MSLLKEIRKRIEAFREGWREGRALRQARELESLYVTKCINGHFFNAMHQSGVCPHSPANYQIGECTRKEGHDGPCNGWPCKYVREKMNIH